jgi:hypothetical protein
LGKKPNIWARYRKPISSFPRWGFTGIAAPGLVAVQEAIRRNTTRMREMALRMHEAIWMDLGGEAIGECLVRAMERFKEMGNGYFFTEREAYSRFIYAWGNREMGSELGIAKRRKPRWRRVVKYTLTLTLTLTTIEFECQRFENKCFFIS